MSAQFLDEHTGLAPSVELHRSRNFSTIDGQIHDGRHAGLSGVPERALPQFVQRLRRRFSVTAWRYLPFVQQAHFTNQLVFRMRSRRATWESLSCTARASNCAAALFAPLRLECSGRRCGEHYRISGGGSPHPHPRRLPPRPTSSRSNPASILIAPPPPRSSPARLHSYTGHKRTSGRRACGPPRATAVQSRPPANPRIDAADPGRTEYLIVLSVTGSSTRRNPRQVDLQYPGRVDHRPGARVERVPPPLLDRTTR